MLKISAYVLAILGFFYVANFSQGKTYLRAFTRVETKFEWETLTPSKTLRWVNCDTNRQCARLELPLNYADPTNIKRAIVAITRIPSPLLGTKGYRGPLLLNPGGPGGSGVDFVALLGANISVIAGPQFDIVSFDPRGVSRTRPRASFTNTCEERKKWGTQTSMNASADAYAANYGAALVQSNMAYDRDVEGDLRYITTDLVARDMLEITRAMGFEKVKYWGMSYGTVLGATFAAMFPNNIERLVLDAVMDAENYYSTLWDLNLLDTDDSLSHFFKDCAFAGPQSCAFHADTPALIEAKLNTLVASVRKTPLVVTIPPSDNSSKIVYGLVDYNMVRMTLFNALYKPFNFPGLAVALEGLRQGNGTALLTLAGIPTDCGCGPLGFDEVIADANMAIICTDGDAIEDSYDQLHSRYGTLLEISPFYEFWDARMQCSGWKVRAPKRFTGPFVAATSHPILFIGNTADPVTPLRSAHKMSKGFAGSVVLTQNSTGHGSLAAVSLCTAKYIRAYFLDGTLPQAETVCDTDVGSFPFSDLLNKTHATSGNDKGDMD